MGTNNSLPLLCYILVCESVGQREDGKINVEGLLSRLVYVDMPIRMPPLRLSLKVVVSMYCEDESLTHEIRYALVTPDGKESELGVGHIGNLDGQYRPIVENGLDLAVDTPGTYWIKLYLGSHLWGQYPVIIAYLQMSNS